MQNIKDAQNTKKILKLNFMSKKSYNISEKLSYIIWVICILNVFLAFYDYFFSSEQIIIIGAIFILTELLICLLIKIYIQRGAAGRMYMDYILFNFKFPKSFHGLSKDKLCSLATKCESRFKEEASINYSNTGQDDNKGVKDWYTDIPEKLDDNNKILYCQKQNIEWDKNYSKLITVLSITVIIGLVVIVFIFNMSSCILENILKICMLLPLILKVGKEIHTLCRVKSISDNESYALDHIRNPINKDYLVEIQELIDERRLQPYIVPNLLHKITSKKMHKEIEETNKDIYS